MSNGYSSNRLLSSLPNFSPKDWALAEKAVGQEDEQRRKDHESRGRGAEVVVEDLRRQLQNLLGAKKAVELREGLRRERLAFRDLWQPPQGLDLDYAKQKSASRRKVDALLRKLGASPEKLAKIGGAFQEKLTAVLGVADGKVFPGYSLPKYSDKWTSLSPLHKFALPWGIEPPPVDPNDPHRWFLFRPPFFGFLFSFAPQTSDNFRVDRELILSPPAGLVGNIATQDCDDAGDFDFASVTAESQIAFGFVPPVAGLVEVLIDCQSTIGTHHIGIEDEFGFSNAWCHQHNYLMMNVLHPNVPEASIALMSNADADTDGDDLTVDRQNLTRAQHYFAQLFSSGPVPAGQSVIITAGTRTFDIARANDMELHSRSNFQWFVNSVEVRIAP